MRRRILPVFLFIFAICGTVLSRAGQQSVQGGRISGLVLDAATGQGLKGARVILESRASVKPQETVTDDTGRFTFDQLQPSAYFVHAEQDGYITDHLPPGYAKPVPLSLNIQAGRDYTVSLRM